MKALGEWVLIDPNKTDSMLSSSVTYENDGTVISVGEGVTTLKEGDRVHFKGKSDLLFRVEEREVFKVKYQDIVCKL